ncbi:YopX family protein [Bacillus wiedmannii]|uniref:YopX family protein n=1 Tax=Bacillus wiedmannii TaxID=1890302 RepID=UPI000BF0FA7A|nr:YopX family protein [Bacillus wiedmannii]PEO25835.1 hypothetical protein CN555_27055 [Bacillus wiedmannii]
MREIKFRVWCKEGPSMLGWDYLINEPDFADFMKGAHVEDAYYSRLMQYTGLKDENGKEIYEGDIVRIFVPHDPEEKEYVSKVYESDGAFVVDMVGYDIYMDVHCIGWIPGGYELEVIGNIYESLDLIKN